MNPITFFDWRDVNAGVAVSFTGEKSGCSCYASGNPTNPFDWDVSIREKEQNLNEAEAHQLRVKLAEAWQFVQKLW